MPTVVLHSGLSSRKIITEPTSSAPIHAPHAINTALPKLIALSLPYDLITSRVACILCSAPRELSRTSSSTEISTIA
jgi:hypothetical protein